MGGGLFRSLPKRGNPPTARCPGGRRSVMSILRYAPNSATQHATSAGLTPDRLAQRPPTAGGTSGDCLELNGFAYPDHLPVRDSKNPTGPAILSPADAWTTFVGFLNGCVK
ncbi:MULTISPECIES: DUF397 domain-containing protein [Streptomyces]